MSRQIKFRVWDSDQNKMIKNFDGEYQIYVNEEDGTLYCGGHMLNGDWNQPPLMQFTGLYDKNRNEIFEGDLLHRHMNVYWVVKFKNSKWIADELKPISGLYLDAYQFVECEIVGNVYENHDVMRCGLSEAEFTERELLLELQRNSQRWFSHQEFDRLKELSNKMFKNAGSPHCG